MPRVRVAATTTDGRRVTLLAATPAVGTDPAKWSDLPMLELAPPTPVTDVSGLASKATVSTEASARQQGDSALDTRVTSLEGKTSALSVTVASQGSLLDTIKKLLGIK